MKHYFFLLLLIMSGNTIVASESVSNKKSELICQLFKIGAIKTGDFRLKSGMKSSIYIDMRCVISYPELFRSVVDLLSEQLVGLHYDHIAGVPYAALPFASGIVLSGQKSMIMPRKEIKNHGMGRAIEGVYKAGQTVIIIEDVITSGSSVLEIVEIVKKEGINVQDVVVFLDRQQGGREKLAEYGITLHAVCTISDLFTVLHDAGFASSSNGATAS